MQRIVRTPDGMMLFDDKNGLQPDLNCFNPQWWQRQNRVLQRYSGRGEAIAVETAIGVAVLRHYRRGGLPARLIEDRYFYTGRDRCRSFREWRILAELQRAGLPVPEPLAAVCQRRGLFYRAALLTRRIGTSHTLLDHLRHRQAMPAADWQALGQTLARFFACGLHHPDLNARNILIDADSRFWLLDFDRATLASRPAAGNRMLARLARSLRKSGLACDMAELKKGL
ncbi:MAG: 3-deoxy-D-manno-octulosonic acid kinase [Wenzhouxiangellaceae bacterium]